ncbi:hypothetical protein ACFQ60_02330 [Streptomyces zhihengii]|uniref:Uncharacterized protein n=1 Tax=Streptomyces zhihengii TaxID=1818004 RepID=A0ABS2V334_9ACTN|nr:hypothetical protein [Streptomyces zhihengii]MBM9624145.1 hypothetical protein [Streptomyces zhihengii]
MPDATTTARLFTTRADLDHRLTTTGTWKNLHTAIHHSAPRMTSYPHPHEGEPVCGFSFTEDTPRPGPARTTGTILITPDGHATIRAHQLPGHRWLTALRHLGDLTPHALRPDALTTPAHPTPDHWALRPHVTNHSFSGHLNLPDDAHAQMLTEHPDPFGNVTAMLTIAPDTPQALTAAWTHATGFCHVLLTGTPAPAQP